MNNKTPLNGPCFESTGNPKKLVFLLHGYGDNAVNFFPLATHLYDPELNINFYAPNAPSFIPQYPIGRQWFDLYPNGINFTEAGPTEKEILKQDCLSSLNLIKDYINNLCIKHKLTLKDCFIIGFSQGAMMAFEFGKYVNNALAGCVLLSGRILPSEDHEKRYFIETPVLIVHGDQDTVLEPKYFEEACEILKNHDFLFDSYLMKNEGHTISPDTLKLTKNFIKKHMT
ncbi:MAG: dienelactone hydrolase family protein [Pelagibacteraceae bacterium]|jgi:phospholipase/carboxylesterase|nr:dienelactone hydrolase family protein [Pelagibacteraceae bacterium]MDP6784866.1 dienelactone hydrolase family protein [Alphaproteobacteria bacterium]MBO6468019.1 dienelactone hydrolase family protein [Pelagibacteraceae bacterium]MBO6468788.1 dienelactone hydrolase family protein [Pelagibacteraceae bacterium]MBO6469702.1 dienelactone hydrolase family protein [Pelagibacteraceae bacterium]